VGWLEGRERGEDVLDSDHDSERSDISGSRPNARYSRSITDVKVISKLLKPYDAQSMRRYAVSNRINHVSNDDPESSQLSNLARIGFSFSSGASFPENGNKVTPKL
jgi:hypothetical protein